MSLVSHEMHRLVIHIITWLQMTLIYLALWLNMKKRKQIKCDMNDFTFTG